MSKIRILHIVGIMNMGGLENFIMNVYRNIDRDLIQFDFLVTREDEGIFDAEIAYLGGKIYNIPRMESVGYIKYKKILYNFFKDHSEEYKIIHCHRNALSSIYLKEAKRANIPIRIVHSHTTNIIEEKNIKGYVKIFIKNIFKKKINKYGTDFFACSKEAGLWLFGEKIANESLIVIKNGIDLNKYRYSKDISSAIRKELEISRNTFLIGHVGRFDLPKNHKFLIKIIKELDKKIDDYKVCLVGDGSIKKEIEELVIKYGLEDKFLFLGIRDNVNELMMAFDLFLFPSLFEGLGIVLIEAQATGLKCLVSNTVPKEADMGIGLFERLPLDNIDLWIENIINLSIINKIDRTFSYKKVREKGYNILDVSERLYSFYTNLKR